VIHYQLPRDTDTYIHRAGRTARLSKDGAGSGTSIVLQAPEDVRVYKKIIKDLNRDEELRTYPVQLSFFPTIKKRVALAMKIDTERRRLTKVR
jgi:ATP-dependent RNA helicase DDX24/MAK5